MSAAWVATITGVAVAVAAAAGWAGRWIWRLLSGTSEFLAEWGGKPEHAGLPATPGIPARLATLERLGQKLVSETQPNDGGNLRDTVARTAADVAAIKEEQRRLRAQIELRNPPGGI